MQDIGILENKNVKKSLIGMVLIVVTCLASFLLFPTTNTAKAESSSSTSSDLEVTVNSSIALSLTNCDSTDSSVVSLQVAPTGTGVFKSNCQTVTINTNAPGYTLAAKASSSTLNYLNPTTITPTPTIASTTAPITTPAVLSNSNWGFAVEGRLNFDSSYTIDNQNNKYATLPTTDTAIHTDDGSTFPLKNTSHIFYYGTRLDTTTMAGTYATTVTYTAVGEDPTPPPATCESTGKAPECIAFAVDVGDTGTYSIPTSGRVANMDHTYDWDVYVDGYLTTDCPDGNCAGTSSTTSDGIVLSGLTNGQHQILIVNHEDSIPGWGNAFGHYYSGGANIADNAQKLVLLNAPLTTLAFSPKVSESTTSASHMFANTFYGCKKLTTSATFKDTYKLPSSITNLSYLFAGTHSGYSTSLTSPVDLTGLSSWLSNNNSITDLSWFFHSTHSGSTNLTSPIDLTPLSGWLRSNTSVTNLSNFFYGVHSENSEFTVPIDFTPLSSWFNANNSITDLNYFLFRVHYNYGRPAKLASPIDLTPFSDWFRGNTSINNLSAFLQESHCRSAYITEPIDLTPLSGWFNANRSIGMAYSFLNKVHYDNYALELSGQIVLPNWIKTLKQGTTNIWNVNYAFGYMFAYSSTLGGEAVNDTEEVKFQDGTVLSSVAQPSYNRNTYSLRPKITPVYPNWQ